MQAIIEKNKEMDKTYNEILNKNIKYSEMLN